MPRTKSILLILCLFFLNSCSVHTFTYGDGPKENFKKTLQKTNKTDFLLALSGGIDSMLLLKIATLVNNDESFNFRAISFKSMACLPK